DRIGVLPERVDLLLRDLRHAHGRGLLQLEYRDADVREPPQRRADILVFDGLMADVVDHAEMLRERALRAVSREPGLLRERCDRTIGIEVIREVIHGLVRRLEEARGLGLEREAHEAAGALAELHEMRD